MPKTHTTKKGKDSRQKNQRFKQKNIEDSRKNNDKGARRNLLKTQTK